MSEPDLDTMCWCGHAYREHNIVTRKKPCFTCDDVGKRCPAFIDQEQEAFFEALSHMPTLSEVYADPAFSEQEEAISPPNA